MNERKLYQKFKDKMRIAEPNAWVYKIPDWIGGGKRPFDFFVVVNGIPFAIEFKSAKGMLTRYQAYQLVDFVNAGGEAMVYQEGKTYMDMFVKEVIEKANERTKNKK